MHSLYVSLTFDPHNIIQYHILSYILCVIIIFTKSCTINIPTVSINVTITNPIWLQLYFKLYIINNSSTHNFLICYYCIGPTILHHVTATNRAYKEEIFGPVLVCLKVDSLEEAIAFTNNNPYGNGCAIFTNSGQYLYDD